MWSLSAVVTSSALISSRGPYVGPPAVTITWSIGPSISLKKEANARLFLASKVAILWAPIAARGLVQPFGITRSENDVRTLRPGLPSRLEADAGTATDDYESLTQHRLLASLVHRSPSLLK